MHIRGTMNTTVEKLHYYRKMKDYYDCWRIVPATVQQLCQSLKRALHLWDWHIFMWQSLEIFNVFNTSTLKHVFWKTKTFFFLKLKYRFFRWKCCDWKHFNTKLSSQKPIFRQIEWEVQNGPIKKNRFLQETTFFYWKFNFTIWTSNKWMNEPTTKMSIHIHTFRKRLSFIWECVFPLTILKLDEKLLNMKFCDLLESGLLRIPNQVKTSKKN